MFSDAFMMLEKKNEGKHGLISSNPTQFLGSCTHLCFGVPVFV